MSDPDIAWTQLTKQAVEHRAFCLGAADHLMEHLLAAGLAQGIDLQVEILVFGADPRGGLKDMSARVAMLRMHDDGLISLPSPRHKRPDQRVRISTRSNPGQPLEKPARTLKPLVLQRVHEKSESRLWNELIERYHYYLGHKPLPGAQLRYLVYSSDQPVALLGFGAAWMSAPRDRYIGWSHEQRKRQLHLVVNNARFLRARFRFPGHRLEPLDTTSCPQWGLLDGRFPILSRIALASP